MPATLSATQTDVADPRHRYPRPPFPEQQQQMPGSTEAMQPRPDHGESTYRGSDRLAGRVAIVTGADSGIGRALSLAYAREGADVVIAYLSEDADADETVRLVSDAGVRCHAHAADLTSSSACEDLINDTVNRYGKLSILVNNAAYQQTASTVEDFSNEVFDRIFKTNVYAPFYLSKAALAVMTPGDCIINTASIQSYDPSGDLLPYAASKSAVVGMTKAMAKLAISRGIRVNAVAPGPVWTPFIPGSMPPKRVETFGESSLFGRPAQPAELAPLYVWLASDEASYVTGEVYGATGGPMPL